MCPRILLIENDSGHAGSLKKELEAAGCQTHLVSQGDQGLAFAKAQPYDLVITEYRLPGLSGLDLIGRLHTFKPRLPIILMTAYGSPETAIEASKLGAFDYLAKPFEMHGLLYLVAKAVACNNQPRSAETVTLTTPPPAMAGCGRAMQCVFKDIGRAAATTMTALIRGETGTGKEVVARAIHEHSNRAAGPFIPVSCNALPETLVETELFGHERGAYTGAGARRTGRFEQACHGTIFLDEIGDLNLGMQVKLLRVLQDKVIQRVGSNDRIPVDVRVLAATHRNLESAMEQGQFRQDLFYRLSVLTIYVPPLRERLDDLGDLVKCFLQRSALETAITSLAIHREAIEYLCSQLWPGNVRELENVVRHASLLAGEHPISLAHVREAHSSGRKPTTTAEQSVRSYLTSLLRSAQRNGTTNILTRMTEEMERELFYQAIRMAQGNQSQAARWLGVSRTTMREKLLQFGLHPHPYQTDANKPGNEANHSPLRETNLWADR
jgi:DNA-binding NtrC family response regulator